MQAEFTRLQAQTERGTKSSSKRKSESQTAAQANIHSKRRKTQENEAIENGSLSPIPEQAPSKMDGPAGPFPADASTVIKKLLQSIFTLQQSSLSDNVSPATISMRVNVVCDTMSCCVDHSVIFSGDSDSNTLPPEMALSQICPRVLNTWAILLSAIERLPAYNRQDDPLPRIITDLSGLFGMMLGRLHRLALDGLTRREVMERSRNKRTKPNSKAAQDSPQRDEAAFEKSAASLVHALSRCLTSSVLENDTHCRILKALLTTLLDHIGSSLSLLIFADPEVGEGIDPPLGLQHVTHIDTASAIAAAELEAPYLIAILKPVLAYLRDKQAALPIRSREALSGSRETMGNNLLADKIEQRLQDTLMRGVFGDEDRKFQEAFTREPSPEDDAVKAAVKDLREAGDRSSWFVGQLWELLGWDILSGQMAGRS